MNSEVGFLLFKTSLAFTQLRKTFIKALILYYFDPNYYIQIETNISGYVINKVLN